MGGLRLSKKAMQAMETKTPMMLLFVCNGTDQSSIATNLCHMLDIAYKDIDKEGMMPEQYENRDLPKFALRLNVPCLPEKKSAKDNKAYDHLREHGKKAFHLEVAKLDQFFTFLANHAHRMGLDAKYFGKFAKLTATLPGQRRPPEQLLPPLAVYPGASKLPLELYIGHDQRDRGFGRIGDCLQPYYQHEGC